MVLSLSLTIRSPTLFQCLEWKEIKHVSALQKEIDRAVAFADGLTENPLTDWRQAWTDAAQTGLLGLGMPNADGQALLSTVDFVAVMRALGAHCGDNGFALGLNCHVWTVQKPLAAFGSPAQKETYLSDLANGRKIGAYALTEEASGSDALGLSTRAEKRDGGYVLNGAKRYIGMATGCDIALVFASTAPERKSWGLSVFIVEAGDAGFTRGPEQHKIGLKTLPFGEMSFKDCWIPEDRRLGPEGAGAQIFQATLDWERAFILAPHVGAMQRQLAQCTAFAKDRVIGGKPIIEHQSVANRLADMAVRLETSQLMMEQAARLYDDGAALSKIAAMTNLHISESFLASSTDAMRIFAGAGYLEGSSIGADFQDSMGGVLYSGTSDVQRQIITRLLAHQKGI